MKYAIYRSDIGMYCRWNESVILFRNNEQVNQFMEEFAFFFVDVNPEDIHIIVPDVIPSGAMIINYEDISEEEKEECKENTRRRLSHE